MESETYRKAFKLTLRQIEDNPRNLRYITAITLPGIYSALAYNYGLGHSNEVVQGVRDGITYFVEEKILGGCEATFVDETSWKFWTNLSVDDFEVKKKDAKGLPMDFDLIKAPRNIFEENN